MCLKEFAYMDFVEPRLPSLSAACLDVELIKQQFCGIVGPG